MKAQQRVLDEMFEGSEHRFESFVRNDHECRRAILQCSGLDVGDAELVEFNAEFYGIPDIVVRLADGHLAVIELCFELSLRHAFRDFAYVLDPASKDVAAIVWVCDSVPASVPSMIRYYADAFGLSKRITLEILVAGRFDGAGPMRFTFDPMLRDLRAGAPRRCHGGITVLERLIELHRSADEIDTTALARILGVSQTWITLHAAKPKLGHALLPLDCKKAPNGTRLRGADGRFLFNLDPVSSFVEDFERIVTRLEVGNTNGAVLPLVSARDPRIGSHWLTLEGFRRETPTRQYRAIKRRLGTPAAFCISSSGRGYSPLWPAERRSALRPLVANNNASEIVPSEDDGE